MLHHIMSASKPSPLPCHRIEPALIAFININLTIASTAAALFLMKKHKDHPALPPPLPFPSFTIPCTNSQSSFLPPPNNCKGYNYPSIHSAGSILPSTSFALHPPLLLLPRLCFHWPVTPFCSTAPDSVPQGWISPGYKSCT